MAMVFTYCCPKCGTTNRLHDFDCEYEEVDIREFEKCYVDILSTLITRKAIIENADGGEKLAMDWDWLTDNVPGPWTSKHTDCLHLLKRRQYVVEHDEGKIEVLHPEDRKANAEPGGGDIELVYRFGACNGCLDYGVSAMVSWCEMNERSWDETVEFVESWLHDTGTWERGDFEEPDPETLIANKRHIWEKGIGWSQFAESTVSKLADRGLIPDDEMPTNSG